MITNRSLKQLSHLLLALFFTANAQAATDISSEPLSTYTATSSTDVKPNILFILDDSGSMDSNYLPDWANDSEPISGIGYNNIPQLFKNNGFNGLAYNPAVTYLPPVYYTAAGVLDTTTYPGFGSPWTAVKDDGYGIQSTSTSNLVGNASYYTFVNAEYCSTVKKASCVAASGPTVTNPYPAGLRWCTTAALTSCQSTNDSSHQYPRYPGKSATATVTVTASGTATSIQVNGKEILSVTAASNSNLRTNATNILNSINACTAAATGTCTVAGYSAVRIANTSTVVISAPSSTGAITYTPVVSGTATTTITAFIGGVPGSNVYTNVVSTTTAYSYAGTSMAAPTRTDCTAGSPCNYAQEMTNYANWWAYYHTRMQMMKTASSNAFSQLDSTTDLNNNVSRFRVGFLTISDGQTASSFLNLDEFKTAQKNSWLNTLFSSNPSPYTPLRGALARAGQLYAGKLNGTTVNGVTVTDPLQYSCQQNYTILSTDGYWNTHDETTSYGPFKLDGSTSVGEQDGGLEAPMWDGGSAQWQKRTSDLQAATITRQQQIKQLQRQDSYLQSSTSNLLKSTYNLRSSTSQLQKATSTMQSSTSTLQSSTSQLQISTSQLQKATSTNSGTSYGTWTNVTSCTWVTSGTNRTKCQYLAYTVPANTGSCTTLAQGTVSTNGTIWTGPATNCTYAAWTTPATVPSCTTLAQGTGTTKTGPATNCTYTAWTTPATATSCTPLAQGTGTTKTGPAVACTYLTWTTPTTVTSCTPLAQGTGAGTWSGPAVACSYLTWTTPATVTSCTTAAQGTGAGTWSGPATACTYDTSPTTVTATSCTTVAQGTGTTKTGPAVSCAYDTYSAPTNVSSCTTVAQGTGTTKTGPATACSYSTWSTAVGVSTCTPISKSSSSPYSVAKATQCPNVTIQNYTVVPSCTDNAVPDANGYTVQCQTVTGTPANASTCTESASQTCSYTNWSGWGNVSSCTIVPKSLQPNFTVSQAVDCQDVGSGGTADTLADVAAYYYGTDLRNPDTTLGVNTTGTCTGPIISPATTGTNLCTDNVPSNGHRDVAAWQHMTTYTLGLGAEGDMVYQSDYLAANSEYNSALANGDFFDIWKKTGASASNASNSICSWQTSGTCVWPVPASDTSTNVDDLWHAAVNGRGAYYSARDPVSLASGLSMSLQTIAHTPRPGAAAAAAVSNPNLSNGDNYVFSSSYKTEDWYGEMVRGQLDPVTKQSGPAEWSALTLLDCATSTWVANRAYAIKNTYSHGGNCYKVAIAYTADATFGSKDTSNSNLVVDMNGNSVVPLSSRTIYTKGSTGLIPFTWGSLSSTQQSYFEASAITFATTTPFVGLSQFCTVGACLTAAQQSNNTIATGGAAGEAMVNFLRGDRSNEGSFYRLRTHVLGDIVSSEGSYVKQPLFNYVDTNFGAYVTAMATRASRVYAGANDGMLHAFDATTGQEAWAYIPGIVLPNVYKLADKNYKAKHQFFVDGSPVTGDICPNAPGPCSAVQWKTILVGGLNSGGKGYYALDVTDPAAPSLLWEINSSTSGFANLGFTYGNPVITKLQNGIWVVIFASGYNNADGKGHLYVVNANTGAFINDISTNVGSVISPSGLARIVGYAPQSLTDNTSVAVYGGDLYGNLWRFDINSSIGATGFDAQLMVKLVDGSGNSQPITEAPTVTTVNANPVVYVGTGRYLGLTDISDSSQQSFYAVKDSFGSTAYPNTIPLYNNDNAGNPRSASNKFIQQTLTSTTCPLGTDSSVCISGGIVRTVTSNTVNWSTDNGWYLDFFTSGERSATDPQLGLGTLTFTTFTPGVSTVNVCGEKTADAASSFSYQLDYLTGGAVVGTNGVAAVSLGATIPTRPVMVRLPDGSVIELIRTSGGSSSDPTTGGGTTTGGEDDGGGNTIVQTHIKPPTGAGTHRVTWRQLQ